jgi:hypothetical protein
MNRVFTEGQGKAGIAGIFFSSKQQIRSQKFFAQHSHHKIMDKPKAFTPSNPEQILLLHGCSRGQQPQLFF